MRSILTIAVLILSFNSSYALPSIEEQCARARQHASSTKELVVLAAANGITISKKDRGEIDKCFAKQKLLRKPRR